MNTQQDQEFDILLPFIRTRFNAYPGKGRDLEPQLKDNGDGCRKGYG